MICFSAAVLIALFAFLFGTVAGASSPWGYYPSYPRYGDSPPIISLYVSEREGRNNAFRLALRQGRIEDAKALLAKGAEVNSQSDNGMTALMYAAQRCEAGSIRFALRAGADPNLVDSKGRSALIHAARASCVEGVRYLIAAGAHVGARDEFGKTAFEYARRGAILEVGGPFTEIEAILRAAGAINDYPAGGPVVITRSGVAP